MLISCVNFDQLHHFVYRMFASNSHSFKRKSLHLNLIMSFRQNVLYR